MITFTITITTIINIILTTIMVIRHHRHLRRLQPSDFDLESLSGSKAKDFVAEVTFDDEKICDVHADDDIDHDDNYNISHPAAAVSDIRACERNPGYSHSRSSSRTGRVF
jgi:hypothetical protein